MPIVNTAELTGEALNWAVGKADGRALQIQPAQYGIPARVFEEAPSGLVRYRPIVEWMQCGPLLEKYAIGLCGDSSEAWRAYTVPEDVEYRGVSPDMRTAICRAVVSTVSGPAVDVPEALLCPTCNLRKHAKDPIAWANENGRLL